MSETPPNAGAAGSTRFLAAAGLLCRRFLWVAAYAFWMGGFSFYGGVVIPVGSRVVAGGEPEFGFITRLVTFWLNVTGGVALAVFLFNLLLDRRDIPRWAWRMLMAVWLAMTALQVGLWLTHPAMDRLLDPESLGIRERDHFRRLHTSYLLMSSLQWAGSLLLLAGTLAAWRQVDRGITPLYPVSSSNGATS